MLERTGHLDDAVTTLADAAKVFPQDPSLAVHSAQIQYRLKHFDAAIAALKPALAIPGDHLARAHMLMALLVFHQGDSAGAVKELDEAIKAAPGMAEAYYQKGQVCEGMKDFDLAKASYEKALQLNPTYTDAIFAIRRLEANKTP